MPKPTALQLFGSSAQVATESTTVNATTSNPALIIRFSDLSSTGWNSATGSSDPEKWLAALILKAREWYLTNSDQVPNVAIADPFPGLTTRNNELKREYSYTVSIYEPDNGAAQPDPDNV